MGAPAGRCVVDRLPGGTGEKASDAAAAGPGEPELEGGERRDEKRDTGDAADQRMRVERPRERRDEMQQSGYRPDAQRLAAEERERSRHARDARTGECHRE